MQASLDLTTGHANLENILKEFPSESPHWNEAQNRFQFIDRMLTECLGWERLLISVEDHNEQGYTDYILGNPGKAILEAKREAAHFDILPPSKTSKSRKIREIYNHCKKLKSAIDQVISYCAITGIPTAVICNGPQLIIFKGIQIGLSPLDGLCFVFNGFDEYQKNFNLIWKYLSPEGLYEEAAFHDLDINRNIRIPSKASISFIDPRQYRYRSSFQESLKTLSSLLLEDIENHPDVKRTFYNECYVPIEANNRHLLLSKNMISARYRRASGDSRDPVSIVERSFRKTDRRVLIDNQIVAEAFGSRPIVVVGDVGVGKTSFFENLELKMVDEAADKFLFIHINLGEGASLTTSINDYVIDEIPKLIKEKYQIDIRTRDYFNKVYSKELLEFQESIYGFLKGEEPTAYARKQADYLSELVEKRAENLKRSLNHLIKTWNRDVVIVFDNADQRDFSIQQQAFLIAQELAKDVGALIFVALRPSTFHESKLKGALSGYQNRVFSISPPPADVVIEKRLSFALRVAEGKIAPATLEGIGFNLGSISAFMKATLRSIRDNDGIQAFLANITGGNTRMVIELITGFFGSPNVDSEKIVNIERDTGNYKVPMHEFTKHALLGDYAYFNNLSSQVAGNLYDVTTADRREHFLKGIIISFLSSSHGVKDADGFIRGKEIVRELSRFSFRPNQIKDNLRVLASLKLIETPHAHFREVDVESAKNIEDFDFRATTIGIYHLRHWMGTFGYLDAMATDTPVFVPQILDKISQIASSFNIEDRLTKASVFRDYLLQEWAVCGIVCEYFDFRAHVSTQSHSFTILNSRYGRLDTVSKLDRSGITRFFDPIKGFGFIRSDQGEPDTYFNLAVFSRVNSIAPALGTRVQFAAIPNAKGLVATRVQVVQ